MTGDFVPLLHYKIHNYSVFYDMCVGSQSYTSGKSTIPAILMFGRCVLID